jgi:hypothetical protein
LLLILLSWAGMIIHNHTELPDLPVLRPEYLIPTGITSILTAGWFKQPSFRRLWSWLQLIWTGIHFVVGAWLSVLPLSIWPFYSEQSFSHYLAHVVYGVAQIPLLLRLMLELWNPAKQTSLSKTHIWTRSV